MLSFAYPAWLFGLLLLPLLALLHWQQVQRERLAVEAFAREPLWAKMGLNPGTDARFWRGVLVLLALAFALLALAQPRWGASGADGQAAPVGSMVIMLDVSKSMLARDAGGDTRLHAGQRTLDELLPALAGWKIGVVAFAGEAQALVPLTTDHTAVETLLSRAQPGQAAGKGSSLEAGLKTSLGLFNQPGRKVLMVISDGEELSGNGRALIPQLRQKGVQVLALGVGSTQGAAVPAGTDMWGNPTPVTYRGEQVVSKLNEETLKALASDTSGRYWHPESPLAVKQMAGMLGGGAAGKAPAAGPSGARAPQGYELFQLPLALSLLLVLLDAAWGLIGRPRAESRFADHLNQQLGARKVAPRSWWQRLGARLKRPALGVVLLAIAFSQTAWTWYPTWLPNWEAGKAYQAGDWEGATAKLHGALKADPDNWRLHYNMGNTSYSKGNYYGAIGEFQRAWELADDASRPSIGYNLGNAYFRQAEVTGDDPKAYQRAITEYERVLQERPDDKQASDNLAFARARLKEAQQKQQQKQGQSGQPQNGGQGGQGNNPTPVGVQQQKKPLPDVKNLPSEAEVDALLKALEGDERQRQAEQGAEQAQDPQGAFGQNLLQQALGQLDMQKDW